MRWMAAVLCLSMSACAAARYYAKSPGLVVPEEETSSRASSSVLLVVEEDNGTDIVGYASAFACRWNGADGVICAWHTAGTFPDRTLVLKGGGEKRRIGPFKRVGMTDVAWCRTPLPEAWHPLTVRSPGKASSGRCVAWGYPQTEDRLMGVPCADEGRSAPNGEFYRENPDARFRAFRGIAIPGMSGGPIVDEKGDVVAIVSTTLFPGSNLHYGTEIPQ